MINSTPPKFAERILSSIANKKDKVSILGDMDEEYNRIAREKGNLIAKLWYWTHVLVSLPAYIFYNLKWVITMFKNYMKIAIRQFLRHKGYSIMNLANLSVGMAVFILVLLYVLYELSFDRYHKNADNIYRVIWHQPGNYFRGSDFFDHTQGPLAPTLMNECPEVVSAARLQFVNNILVSYDNKSFLENDIAFADPEIFEIFYFKLTQGNIKDVFEHPNSVFLSEKTAEKYFGHEDPIGKNITISYRGSFNYTVMGIIKNVPKNSHFHPEFVIPFKTYISLRNADISRWFPSWFCYTYCLLKEGADTRQLEKKLAAILEKNNVKIVFEDIGRLLLQPLKNIHLYSHINGEISDNGDIKYIYIFLSAAFLVLIISCFNYMNLAASRSAGRSREVGIRKVVGSYRRQLFIQFVGESVFFTGIAFLISILLVIFLLPPFNAFIGRDISLNLVKNKHLLFILPGLILFVGLFAGIYPAVFVSSLKPASVLGGSSKWISKKKIFRNFLVSTQFVMSVILIIGSIVVRNQLNYIRNMDVGFEKEKVIVLNLRDPDLRGNTESLKNEFLKNPNILSVSSSAYLPDRIDSFDSYRRPGEQDKNYGMEELGNLITFYEGFIDQDFIDLYGIKLLEGRNFSKEFSEDDQESVIVNETAARMLSKNSPLGVIFGGGSKTRKVIGVVADFNFHSLHSPIKPLILRFGTSFSQYISVKIKGINIPETIIFMQIKMKSFTPYPFEYRFFDEMFDETYRTEQQMGTLLGSFTLLAVFLACLGLFGLSAYSTVQRTKEIGIRKVLGAGVSDIIYLLFTEFTKWVLIANIAAWPIAYFIMNRWLQQFAFRIKPNIFLFLLTGVLVTLVSILTVSVRSLKAARANPVNSLRYE